MTHDKARKSLSPLVAYSQVAGEKPVAVWTSPTNPAKSFFFYQMRATWNQARAHCQSQGGNLATISNMEENSAVANTISGYSAWIGLNDMSSEGNFVWADGDDSTYRNFLPGEPNEMGSEDCVEIFGTSPGFSYWNDNVCRRDDRVTGFVCSKVM